MDVIKEGVGLNSGLVSLAERRGGETCSSLLLGNGSSDSGSSSSDNSDSSDGSSNSSGNVGAAACRLNRNGRVTRRHKEDRRDGSGGESRLRSGSFRSRSWFRSGFRRGLVRNLGGGQ